MHMQYTSLEVCGRPGQFRLRSRQHGSCAGVDYDDITTLSDEEAKALVGCRVIDDASTANLDVNRGEPARYVSLRREVSGGYTVVLELPAAPARKAAARPMPVPFSELVGREMRTNPTAVQRFLSETRIRDAREEPPFDDIKAMHG